MPVRVRTAKDLGLVVVDFEGVVTADEFQNLAPMVESPDFALLPLGLVDTTGAERADAPSEMVRHQARRAADHVDAAIEPGAKMALVADRDEFFGLGRMYQALRGDSPVEIRVFRSRPEAEQWLGLGADYETELADVPSAAD